MPTKWFLYSKHTSKILGDPKGYENRFAALRHADQLFGVWHTDAIGVFFQHTTTPSSKAWEQQS